MTGVYPLWTSYFDRKRRRRRYISGFHVRVFGRVFEVTYKFEVIR